MKVRINGYYFKHSVRDFHRKVEKTVRDSLVPVFCFLLFHHTYIHIQDLMSLISFNKKLATYEEYCEENGDQMINVV